MEEWIWWLMIIIGLIVLLIFFIIMIIFLIKMDKVNLYKENNLFSNGVLVSNVGYDPNRTIMYDQKENLSRYDMDNNPYHNLSRNPVFYDNID